VEGEKSAVFTGVKTRIVLKNYLDINGQTWFKVSACPCVGSWVLLGSFPHRKIDALLNVCIGAVGFMSEKYNFLSNQGLR